MSGRTNRDILLGDVDADAQTLGVDIREVTLGLLWILMGYIETDMIQSVNLHLLIDGTSHDVTRSQTQSLIIFLHETFAVRQTQNAAITTHSLGDEEGRMGFARMIKSGWVELDKLHVGHGTLGTVNHRLAITSSDDRVGGSLINSTASTGTHHGNLTQIGIHLLGIRIQYVCTVTVDIRSAASNTGTEMMLSDNLYCKMIFLDIDIRTVAHSLHQTALDFCTRIICMMKDAELAVTALTVEVELAVLLLIEVDAPLHELLDLLRCHGDNLLHSFIIADIITSNHCILYVLVEVIHFQVGN